MQPATYQKVDISDVGRSHRASEYIGLAVVFVQVVLVGLILSAANIETRALHRLVYIAAGGFVVNHLLPLRLRLRFFAGFSVACLVVILGGNEKSRMPDFALGLSRAGAILGIGAILIAICHLPIGFWKRVGLLLGVGLIGAAFRAGVWPSGSLAIVWPVLASMFMFRVMVYLYDVSTSPKRPSRSQAVSYFFLIPNVCTLLFPVIDFRTFCQKYYDEEAMIIYQRGVAWMARGAMQFLVYRLVKGLFALEPSNVIDGADVVRFAVANVFLYLKISGLFHLFAGMLLLFGFNLPETNRRYFLASSFTDYWQRVNTYWRVFIMKVFYYPAFFRCKSLGQTPAVILATLWSFFITWAFHLYQTWWAKGAATPTWPDGLFWSALAVLVLVNSLWGLKRNRKRKLSASGYGPVEAVGLAVRTAATFGIITILWSLWSTPTLALWLHIWSLADLHSLAWGGVALAGVMIATILFEVLPGVRRRPAGAPTAGRYAGTRRFRWDAARCALLLTAMLLIANRPIDSWLDVSSFRPANEAHVMIEILRGFDRPEEGGGYYENLTDVEEGASQFSQTMSPDLSAFPTSLREIKGSVFSELVPNTHLEKNGVHFDSNRWGMRDRDYEQAKPPDMFRMALLGSSHVMGYALPQQDMFKSEVEDRLNAGSHAGERFEIMNFSANGQSPLGQIWLLQNRLPAFHPDIVILVAHLIDSSWMSRDVARSLRERIPLPADFPSQILTQAGVDSRTLEPFLEPRLRPYEPALLSFSYGEIVRLSRAINALPVCVFLPVPNDLPLNTAEAADLVKRAKDAGFVLIDFSHIYDGLNPKDLMLDERMHHSNAKANAIVAAALYDRLITDPRIDLLKRVLRGSKIKDPP